MGISRSIIIMCINPYILSLITPITSYANKVCFQVYHLPHLFFCRYSVVHSEKLDPSLSPMEISLKCRMWTVDAAVLELIMHERAVLTPPEIHDPSAYVLSPHLSFDNTRHQMGYGVGQEAARRRRVVVCSSVAVAQAASSRTF